MASKLISPLALNKDKYYTQKKEMQVWEWDIELENSIPAELAVRLIGLSGS